MCNGVGTKDKPRASSGNIALGMSAALDTIILMPTSDSPLPLVIGSNIGARTEVGGPTGGGGGPEGVVGELVGGAGETEGGGRGGQKGMVSSSTTYVL